jgi:hypothetical protein
VVGLAPLLCSCSPLESRHSLFLTYGAGIGASLAHRCRPRIVKKSLSLPDREPVTVTQLFFQAIQKQTRYVAAFPICTNGQRAVRQDQIRNATPPSTSIATPNRITSSCVVAKRKIQPSSETSAGTGYNHIR